MSTTFFTRQSAVLDPEIAPIPHALMSVAFGYTMSPLPGTRLYGGTRNSVLYLAIEPLRLEDNLLVARRTSDKPDIALAASWVGSCQRLHGKRPDASARELSTRIIDVSNDHTGNAVLVETFGRTGRYAALSHCWGSPLRNPLSTRKENIAQHMRQIP